MDRHEFGTGSGPQDDQGAEGKPGNDAYSLPFWRRVQTSQTVKVVMIGVLILLLQIPIVKIAFVIQERQVRSRQAADEIATKWGREQTILGPIVSVPFAMNCVVGSGQVMGLSNGMSAGGGTVVVVGDSQGSASSRVITQHKVAHFLAEDLHIKVQTENMVRHRGIFQQPVYRAEIELSGIFKRPDFAKLNAEPTEIFWDRATLTILVSDPRTISNKASLKWNKEELEFQPASMELDDNRKGIEVPLKGHWQGENFTFAAKLSLQGSKGLFLSPMAGSTTAELVSNWPHPSFQGEWLPIEHVSGDAGTQANWQISALGSQFEQQWIGSPYKEKNFAKNLFGVTFLQPVDTYRMVERSVKYQFLFLVLTFLSLWLAEVLAEVRLHALHYLLIGSGMCLFYLLELSLAEHLGFLLAYCLAASAIVGLVSCYCLAILESSKRAVTIGGFITFLYGYLYTLLINQDYSLLAGSIALFVLLAAVMYLTRHINWATLRG